MSEYDEEALRQLQEKFDLFEYVKGSFEFTKTSSDSFATRCPRHVDNIPSLVFTPSKNLFHCFSCGCGGGPISWLMTFEHLTFNQAVDKLGKMTGTDIAFLKSSSALTFYRQIRKAREERETPASPNRVILPETELDKYSTALPQEWLDEGIKPDILRRYNIRIDEGSGRIVYPIRDADFNLIGVKGRTRYSNVRPKYMNYQKIGTTDFFVGAYENTEAIKEADEVILFEGIKSGMKLSGWGKDNWMACETSAINRAQTIILIKLGIRDVVVAFDKDVTLDKIKKETKELRRFANVYAVLDRSNLLDEKMSPVDKGREVWEELYERKIRIN